MDKRNDYENWTTDELIQECIHRGFLDKNKKYKKKDTKESIERKEKLKQFMEKHNISYDELFAFFDLAEINDVFRKQLVRDIYGN